MGNRNAIAGRKFGKFESQEPPATDTCLKIPSYHTSGRADAIFVQASTTRHKPSATTDAGTQEQNVQQALSDHGPVADAIPPEAYDQDSEQSQSLLEWLDACIADLEEPDATLDRVQQLEQEVQTPKAALEAHVQADRAPNPPLTDVQQMEREFRQLQNDAQQLGEEPETFSLFNLAIAAAACYPWLF